MMELSLIFLILVGGFGVCRRGSNRFLDPSPALLLKPTLPHCACLVSLHFSECVRPGKLPSLFVPQWQSWWQIDFDCVRTDIQTETETAPDSTGASSSPPFLPLILPPVHLAPPLPLLPPHTPLLQMEEASFIPPFCPLFLPGSLLSSCCPSWVLLLVASVWTVAAGGWRIALSERAWAGPTCSACSVTDSENSLIAVRHLGRISQETAFATARLSCMYTVVSFLSKPKDMFMYCTSAKRLQCH